MKQGISILMLSRAEQKITERQNKHKHANAQKSLNPFKSHL